MNRINILDDLTINKIAAGEVVERPSSVVKELIENCVDAGSTKVIVDITDGGKKLIRITDNGCGIPSSEVDKSFLRHATSKIKNIDDLYDLYSLGFRGEALASISAVSRLEMITKTKDEPVGTKVIVEGGKIISKEPVGATNGTTIIIKDIFFNTPVRQKFLKSNHAETINISDLINKLAIGNPGVQFKYVNNNKPMLNTPGDNKLLSVVRSIYGKEVCENLIPIDFECKHFKLNGFIGNNNVYRSNKNLQHIYINKRFVKSKVVLDAISEAYKGIIPINKHGICFLNMEINPSSIDVNIHPTKLEVKFENEQELYIELRDLLRKSLVGTSLIGKYETYENKPNKKESIATSKEENILVNKGLPKIEKFEPRKEDIQVVDLDNDSIVEGFKSVNEILNEKSLASIKDISQDEEIIINKEISNKLNDIKVVKDDITEEEFLIEGNLDFTKNISIEELEEIDEISNVETVQEGFFEEESIYNDKKEEKRFSLKDYNVIGTVFNTYIVLSKGESMYLLDQHAAHEKVLYEKYMDKFYKSEINMQMLLDPIVLELSNIDMLQVENNLDLFMKFGFEIELFGNNHIMIRCVPTIFGVPESENFILQIIDNIEEIKNNYELKGEKFASMACRAAIKANDKITNLEINSLFEQMEECENPFTCPHGRPVIVEISKNEIEKMFKRIM
ncbi:MAG: DNA mismatch repair endonuclease MutL [Peptostreptococcaceae bacterium]